MKKLAIAKNLNKSNSYLWVIEKKCKEKYDFIMKLDDEKEKVFQKYFDFIIDTFHECSNLMANLSSKEKAKFVSLLGYAHKNHFYNFERQINMVVDEDNFTRIPFDFLKKVLSFNENVKQYFEEK
jgi:hypothetical protein